MSAGPIDAKLPTMALLDRFGPGAGTPPPSLDESLAYVRDLARTHYENFSVLSSLVPADLRDDFAAVYAFCRWADDLGDETGATPEARTRSLELLAWWKRELNDCFAGRAAHPVFIALAHTVQKRRLTVQPFTDLIDAFEQDQRVTRYDTWDQVVDYCRRSADPVGRIVLALAGYHPGPDNIELYRMSDAICTALQLTNFWQDVRRDLLERDRVYLPFQETGIPAETLRHWAARPEDPAARVPYIKALRPLSDRTRELFHQGRPLASALDHAIRPVVWLFWAGGMSVLNSIERAGCATLWQRPTLTKASKATLLFRAWLRAKLGRAGVSSRR